MKTELTGLDEYSSPKPEDSSHILRLTYILYGTLDA